MSDPKTALLEQHGASGKKIERIDLDLLSTDAATQLRVNTDPVTVDLYAGAYAEGHPLPPIMVFHEKHGERYHLADGHHRVAAARQAKLAEIEAIIKPGTERDAILYACGANGQHGLPLTLADKRRVVQILLADAEWRTWSDREIARRVVCSPNFVAGVRKELGATATARKGKDGKTRALPKKGKADPEPGPAPLPSDPDQEPVRPAGKILIDATDVSTPKVILGIGDTDAACQADAARWEQDPAIEPQYLPATQELLDMVEKHDGTVGWILLPCGVADLDPRWTPATEPAPRTPAPPRGPRPGPTRSDRIRSAIGQALETATPRRPSLHQAIALVLAQGQPAVAQSWDALLAGQRELDEQLIDEAQAELAKILQDTGCALPAGLPSVQVLADLFGIDYRRICELAEEAAHA